MSKFPVESSDQEGLRDAVNYLLSGPGGLGQNFAGFSDYHNYWLTGNFRTPFTQDSVAKLYVAGVPLSNAEQIDSRTIKYTFSGAPLASAPFSKGNALNITGITPAAFNSVELQDAGASIFNIGVIECTDTYVIVRTQSPIEVPLGTYVSGGSANYRLTEQSDDSFYSSTDCNARVTVNGGTDRVFLSAQLTQTISYDVLSGPVDLSVWVAVRRYKGFTNNDPVNPDYLFGSAVTISRKIYTFAGLTGTGQTLNELETIFSTVIDQPEPGYYWYTLEVLFEYPNVVLDVQVTEDQLGLRSLSAQVVKQ